MLNTDFSPLCHACFHSLEHLSSPICYYCGVPLPGNLLGRLGICSQCRSSAPIFDFARAYGPYGGKLRKVIRRLKFEGFQRLVHPLAALLEQCYQHSGLDLQPHWILPVPLHQNRRRRRGFDQTLLLGQLLSRRLGVPLFRGLRRVRNTPALFGLDIGQRGRTISGAFALRDAQLLSHRSILLVDDVMTTGTTVTEISRLLRQQSNINTITVLTVARATLLRAER